MTLSTRLFAQQMLNRFDQINEAVQTRQTQIATGQRITESADAPVDAVRLSAVTELREEVSRYQDNVTTAQRRLSLGDDVLETADNILSRLRELSIAAANDAMSADERNAIRIETLELRDAMLSLANTRDNAGQALFGGYATDQSPFVEGPDGRIAYLGDGGEHTLAASDTMRLPTSVNGAKVFMQVESGGQMVSTFDIIDSFVAALETAETTSQSATATTSMSVDLVAARHPQGWAFTLTGPDGSAEIAFDAVAGNVEEAASAINAVSAQTGVSATDVNGRLELSATGDIALSNLRIEGVDRAFSPPAYYASVFNEDGAETTLAPANQEIRAQIARLGDAGQSIAVSRTTVGARLNRANDQEELLTQRTLILEQEIGDISSANIEQVITELQALLVNRDAARQAYSLIGQRSLFDFLN